MFEYFISNLPVLSFKVFLMMKIIGKLTVLITQTMRTITEGVSPKTWTERRIDLARKQVFVELERRSITIQKTHLIWFELWWEFSMTSAGPGVEVCHFESHSGHSSTCASWFASVSHLFLLLFWMEWGQIASFYSTAFPVGFHLEVLHPTSF